MHLELGHLDDLDKFLMDSSDFKHVYKHFKLEDVRFMKESRPLNVAFILSHCVRTMHNAATSSEVLPDDHSHKTIMKVKGAIHIVYRIMPILHEIKDQASVECMWS